MLHSPNTLRLAPDPCDDTCNWRKFARNGWGLKRFYSLISIVKTIIVSKHLLQLLFLARFQDILAGLMRTKQSQGL